MLFDSYLKDIPKLHTWDEGTTWNSGGFEDYHLRAFYKYVTAGARRVIETGAGNSSLAFLFGQPDCLTTIAPERELFDRIDTFARENSLTTSAWEQLIDRSEWALPVLAQNGREYDLALIDGGHGWPTVFVDFCYINVMLARDGILIIDDVQLHSIKELGKLLKADTARFKFLESLGKSKVFQKKTNEKFLPEWTEQPYIRQKSDSYVGSHDRFEI
jgi:hypothetical protein